MPLNPVKEKTFLSFLARLDGIVKSLRANEFTDRGLTSIKRNQSEYPHSKAQISHIWSYESAALQPRVMRGAQIKSIRDPPSFTFNPGVTREKQKESSIGNKIRWNEWRSNTGYLRVYWLDGTYHMVMFFNGRSILVFTDFFYFYAAMRYLIHNFTAVTLRSILCLDYLIWFISKTWV